MNVLMHLHGQKAIVGVVDIEIGGLIHAIEMALLEMAPRRHRSTQQIVSGLMIAVIVVIIIAMEWIDFRN